MSSSSLETQKLIKLDPTSHQSQTTTTTTTPQTKTYTTTTATTTTNKLSLILQEPFQWLKMLSSKLNPTFILGIFLVYGLSQGFSGSFFKVVSDYYWKDVQKLQPSTVQLFIGLYYIPWVMKPIWGLLTDVFPVRGYKRRPYFVLAGVLGMASAMVVSMGGKLEAWVALGCLIGITAAVAIADVTIDACIAKNSIEMRGLAADMQSLCGVCSSSGALLGYGTSGFFVHHLGPQGALGLLTIPPALLVVLGFVIYEVRIINHPINVVVPNNNSSDTTTTITNSKQKQQHHHHYQLQEEEVEVGNLGGAVKGMLKTMQLPQVWKPTLYMYLSLALSISTYEGQFYWFTDPKAGPAFSQELVGMIYAIGAMASIVGVLIYHKFLKDYPFRNLIFFAQLIYGISGILDVIFILRWNLAIGIPDYFFVVLEECISRIITRIRWIPMIVFSTRLCPLGIEGTFFALLMSIDSLGALSSKWGGGIVLHVFHVTRTDFANLWLVVLIRNGLRLATLGLIFLVPNVNQLDELLPSDILSTKHAEAKTIVKDEESLQLVPLKERTEV